MRNLGIGVVVVLVLAASVAIVARSFQSSPTSVTKETPPAIVQPPLAVSEPKVQLPIAAQLPQLSTPSAVPAGSTAVPGSVRSTQPEPRAAAPGSLRLSPPEIERVRDILLTHNIMQTEAADFPLRVGAVVPEDVNLSPLPIELSDMVPAYAHYSYVIVHNQIAIIVSRSREIRVLIPVPAPA